MKTKTGKHTFRTGIAWSFATLGIGVVALSAGRELPVHGAPRQLPTNIGIILTVDANNPIGNINPYIYGMAQPTPEHVSQLKIPLSRWGGNPSTRYNWEKGNHWNAAADWEFRNGNYGLNTPDDRKPSGVADKSIATSRSAGVDVVLTIPTMGWVARDDNNQTFSKNVPPPGGNRPPITPGSDAIVGYDPAMNRRTVSQRSLPRKGAPFTIPPNLTDDVVYQDEWVYHLTKKFGKAKDGGIKFYAMDNEPDLWSSTHRDMHPVEPDYEELLSQYLTYAKAVKDVDSTAKVMGPTSWGWTGYFYSPRDHGADRYQTAADRKAHGNLPFLVWFLQRVAEDDKNSGRRTLDFLDIHYYPQGAGVYTNGTDANTNALRLRSTRGLWDKNYVDESWIGTPVMLIPRMKNWIAENYPGTKLALNEWNWGADNTLNGAIAIGEILGIFGREQLDMACYWTQPATKSPGFYAWKIYRNANDSGKGFGDIAVQATSQKPDIVSCFGSLDSTTNLPVVMLVNKSPDKAQMVTLAVTSKTTLRRSEIYRYSGSNLAGIEKLPPVQIVGNRVKLTLPPYSMTLLRTQK